jgi:hypothetical protein
LNLSVNFVVPLTADACAPSDSQLNMCCLVRFTRTTG